MRAFFLVRVGDVKLPALVQNCQKLDCHHVHLCSFASLPISPTTADTIKSDIEPWGSSAALEEKARVELAL
jgi:hypothetical protein